MVRVIQAAFKQYNANTRGRNVGDCVKRALSVAYSLDYDAVSRELNQIKRETGWGAYNQTAVFTRFMKKRGDTFTKIGKDAKFTVEEFCDSYTTGVYLLLVGSKPGYSDHICAVVDGDLYDSWNSMKEYIDEIAEVSTGKSDVYQMGEDIPDVLWNFMQEYTASLDKKCPDYMTVYIQGSKLGKYDEYTYTVRVRCKLDSVSRYASWRSGATLSHNIVIKLNPRLSSEDNVANLEKKLKQKIYDWVYNIRKDLQDAEECSKIKLNSRFYGDPKDLMKLPEWSRSLVREFSVTDDYYVREFGWDKYSVQMDPLPDDPEQSRVHFSANKLVDLKYYMNMYKKDFSRYGRDY